MYQLFRNKFNVLIIAAAFFTSCSTAGKPVVEHTATIEDPIAEEILKGNFSDGSHIQVKKKADGLDFNEVGKRTPHIIDTEEESMDGVES